jgi:hypothetical protein
MNPPAAIVSPASLSLVEREAHRLFCAHAAVVQAAESGNFAALREASELLCVESSKVYGALAMALREQREQLQIQTPPASKPRVRPAPLRRKGSDLAL